jgi:hypothetical protein
MIIKLHDISPYLKLRLESANILSKYLNLTQHWESRGELK